MIPFVKNDCFSIEKSVTGYGAGSGKLQVLNMSTLIAKMRGRCARVEISGRDATSDECDR
jgi:hypothetical protein